MCSLQRPVLSLRIADARTDLGFKNRSREGVRQTASLQGTFRRVATTDSYPPRATDVEMRASARSVGAVTNHSPPEEKIGLFRSLFRGREDVYPRRFENRNTGKSGYSPACGNEWVRGICEKPRIKCSDCPHQRFLPVTDEVIRWHLSGRDSWGKDFVLGVYPML